MTLIFTREELQNPQVRRGVALSEVERYISDSTKVVALLSDIDTQKGSTSNSERFKNFQLDLEGQVGTELIHLTASRWIAFMVSKLPESDVNPKKLFQLSTQFNKINFTEVSYLR